MRDAFGGVFMFRLMLVFIVIYVAFTAISFKYAKSFKIKNSVIDVIEQNQVLDLENFFSEGSGRNVAKIDNILDMAQYNITCEDVVKNGNLNNGQIVFGGSAIGYCYRGVIITENSEKTTPSTKYYNVYTYVNWELGAMNMVLALGGKPQNSEDVISGRWQIHGEAVVAH